MPETCVPCGSFLSNALLLLASRTGPGNTRATITFGDVRFLPPRGLCEVGLRARARHIEGVRARCRRGRAVRAPRGERRRGEAHDHARPAALCGGGNMERAGAYTGKRAFALTRVATYRGESS